VKWVVIVTVVLAVLVVAYLAFQAFVTNPRVIETLRTEPDSATARRVMLLTLPSGRAVPVNYLREGGIVYAGADGRWWRELDGKPAPVSVLIRGETLSGVATAVRNDPAHTEDVFKRLRPTSYKWIGGVLVEIALSEH
jgi:hypothetical protein